MIDLILTELATPADKGFVAWMFSLFTKGR